MSTGSVIIVFLSVEYGVLLFGKLGGSFAGFRPTVDGKFTLWVSQRLMSSSISIWCEKTHYISRKVMLGHFINIEAFPGIYNEDKGAVIIVPFHFSLPDIKIFN